MMRFSLSFFLCFWSCLLLNAQNVKYRLLSADVLYFDSGKSTILPAYETRLKAAIELLRETPQSYAMIHSHTDSIGSFVDNERLASERAVNVINYLAACGIDTARLKIRSLGEYSPLEDDGTEEGRAKNRCVTFYILAPFDESMFYVKSTIKGKLQDAKTGVPLLGRVLINYLGGRDTVYTDENGAYEAQLDMETYVEVRAYVKGYFFVSKVVRTKNKETHTTDFNLERAIVGGKMLLNDLYFRSGTHMLLPSSEKALEGIFTFLKENETLRIEIGGHINKPNAQPISTESEQFKLSELRARTVYDYLLYRGISKDRLTYKGYGNWEMINPLAVTEIQQQLNRRVELKVLE